MEQAGQQQQQQQQQPTTAPVSVVPSFNELIEQQIQVQRRDKAARAREAQDEFALK